MTTLRKWGNSLGLRIPHDVAKEAGLIEGEEVVFIKRGRGLRVEPVAKPTVSLSALLHKITPQNSHAEIDWGAPRGREVW